MENNGASFERRDIFELLLESGKAIGSEIELENLVQKVTDIATGITGAKFGAFFYNVVNSSGEKYVLYTISGVPREAFSKFPMPRNTKIFDPTFQGHGTIRYDDVTSQPHYGQSAPYHGMPKGHLPVRSYLAAPVIAPGTGEVIGGLFFGHPEVGVFTERSEQLLEGIAAQAAIAMGNAKLFEEKRAAEARQKELSQQYESIFRAASDSIIIYDENGYIQEANPAASRIHGYGYEELLRMHAGMLFKNPEDFTVLKEIAFSGRQYQGVNERIKKDGTVFTAHFVGYQFIFRGKLHVLSMVRDNNSLQVQDALKRSEEFAQIITTVSPTALWMTDHNGNNIYVNQTWLDWIGGSLADHTGGGWLHAVHPDDRGPVDAQFKAVFNQRKVFNQDFRIIRRTGEVRWCSTYGTPYFSQDGSFGGFAGSLTDITERKQAEESLAGQNALINTITNNTQQAIFLLDERQFCTYMNPAAEAMTGYTLAALHEKPLHYHLRHTYPDGRHFPIEESDIDKAFATKKQIKGEGMFIRKNGDYFPVAFIASPIIRNGVAVGTLLESRDITEEKRLQQEVQIQQEKAMAYLEQKVKERTAELELMNDELLQFTSIASHDLKEPVRKVSIFSSRLKEMGLVDDPVFNQYLDNIQRSSQRIVRLIDDLLEFSRLSHTAVNTSLVDLNACIARIIYDLELAIGEKQATIEVGVLPNVEGVVHQLQQVFQNLIQNSLKFSFPERPLRISIKAEQEGNMHVITYEDNGIGFRPEYGDKIFKVFERLHGKEKYEGTGIGLAIVKKIIDRHKGSVAAIGKEGEGAQFIIRLPAT
ncbi:MAG: PAS domain S-box protein [Niastella sp.]|nr:PAS domain S-box protein [Niastella sp.]